jgi:hypothetical protein
VAKKKTKKKKSSWRGQLIGAVGMIAAVVLMPTTIFLFLTMLPSAAAGVSDRIRGGTTAITVGAMNLAGAFPFLLQLWTSDHTLDHALNLATDPRTIIVVYAVAGIGWVIDWAMSGLTVSLLFKRTRARLDAIKKRQEALVKRWGKEVTGEVAIDEEGFAVEQE